MKYTSIDLTPEDWQPLPVAPNLLGESPVWHAQQACLYWTDIPGQTLHRWHPGQARHDHWTLTSEAGCLAPLADGRLLLAQRQGLSRFDPASGKVTVLEAPPYSPAEQRFNDGKVDTRGRLWVGTIHEPRDRPAATLYGLDQIGLRVLNSDCTVSNGLAFPADGTLAYWADTWAHRVYQLPLDSEGWPAGERAVLREFPRRPHTDSLTGYGGRPDGAAMDAEGAYWVAMFEGQCLQRLAPSGETLQVFELPVRCPTMPCFGGPNGRTLYLTTASHNRPADELESQPLAGCVLSCEVPVAGSPIPVLDPRFLPPAFSTP